MASVGKLVDSTAARVVAAGLRFPEGPVALDDGSVLVSELAGAVARVARDGGISRYEVEGGVNGAAFGPGGGVYLANNGGARLIRDGGFTRTGGGAPGNEALDGGSLQRLNLDTGVVETLHTHAAGRHLGWLNDVVFDLSGGCYVVDTTQQRVCYADAAGGAMQEVAADLMLPNGAGLSPDGSLLYVSETTGDVLVWDVEAPGCIANKRVHYHSSEAHGWDGLAVDGAGNVCVANLKASGISVISSDGEEIARFVTPRFDPWVTNMCFGGQGLGTAYICSSGLGLLYSVPWPWGGLRLNFGC